ncbi:ABC transporter substrate-binding protein [Jeotgalibaca porci]|uniref:ABC transporter substrate-binding protein n=1 Tax=Jeotgalibaca porci TaxID=1868793 RepID=UPI003F9149F4
MNKFTKMLAIASVSILSLAACGSESSSESSADKGSSDTLVIYSPNSEGLINATIPAFEEKYDVKVELIQAGTGELFTKLESEKNAPVADIIFGGAYSQYAQSTELFEEYVPEENDQLVDAYQNTTGFYTPYTIDGSVIVVNPDLIGDIDITGYEDLLNEELKGKIATADPANSSSAFAQLTNMLVAKGGYESDEAWKYVTDLFTLIDGKISSSSSNVYKTVADGEMAVGLTYEDPTVKLLNDGANVEIIYPEEGTVFLPASAAIIKGAENLENAKLFIDFVISKEVQDVLGTTTTNRPVRKDAETSENMKELTEIKTLEEDMDYVIENKEKIVTKYNDIFVDIESNR